MFVFSRFLATKCSCALACVQKLVQALSLSCRKIFHVAYFSSCALVLFKEGELTSIIVRTCYSFIKLIDFIKFLFNFLDSIFVVRWPLQNQLHLFDLFISVPLAQVLRSTASTLFNFPENYGANVFAICMICNEIEESEIVGISKVTR